MFLLILQLLENYELTEIQLTIKNVANNLKVLATIAPPLPELRLKGGDNMDLLKLLLILQLLEDYELTEIRLTIKQNRRK